MTDWDKTARYYESLASLQGRDPYSQRALLWYAETCRARSDFLDGQSRSKQWDIENTTAERAKRRPA